MRSLAKCAPNRYLFGKAEAEHNVHTQRAEEVYAFVHRHVGYNGGLRFPRVFSGTPGITRW